MERRGRTLGLVSPLDRQSFTFLTVVELLLIRYVCLNSIGEKKLLSIDVRGVWPGGDAGSNATVGSEGLNVTVGSEVLNGTVVSELLNGTLDSDVLNGAVGSPDGNLSTS